MPKVSKTRKMKMKQRLRHRKSRVIKTKSRKNRYRRTPKYKVGGGTLETNVFRAIRSFIQENRNDVENAEKEYKRLHTEFATSVEGPWFDPDKTIGMFGKKNRLHDILEKIKADADTHQTTRDVGDAKDYVELSESLKKLQRKQAEQTQQQLNASRSRFLNEQHDNDFEGMKKKEQTFHKVFIPDSNMITVPAGLELFELGTNNKVTRIPILGSQCQVYPIDQEVYEGIVSDQITRKIGNEVGMRIYHYKRDPVAHTIYYVHGDGIYDVKQILMSLSSQEYECRIPKGMEFGCITRPHTIKGSPITDQQKLVVVKKLWDNANCLLQQYYDVFTRIKISKIVSPAKNTLTKLAIREKRDDKLPYYNQGTFTGNFTDGTTTVVVDVYASEWLEYLDHVDKTVALRNQSQ